MEFGWSIPSIYYSVKIVTYFWKIFEGSNDSYSHCTQVLLHIKYLNTRSHVFMFVLVINRSDLEIK